MVPFLTISPCIFDLSEKIKTKEITAREINIMRTTKRPILKDMELRMDLLSRAVSI